MLKLLKSSQNPVTGKWSPDVLKLAQINSFWILKRNFNLKTAFERIREEIKKLTPIYEEVTETELENLTIYPKDEEDNEHVYYDNDEVEEEDEEDMAIEEEIMFDHPEFQKHTRKDKTKEHGYITLDKYGTETPFEFPLAGIIQIGFI